MRGRQYTFWFLFCITVLVAVPALIPKGRAGIYPTSVLTSTGITGIIVIGLSLLMGYAGQISLGHAAFYAFGSYASAILGSRLEYSHGSAIWPWLWIVAGMGFSCVVALTIGMPALRLRGHYLAMATLGFGVIVYEIIMALGVTGGALGVHGFPKLRLFGFTIDTDLRWYYTVWITICLLMLLSLQLIHSRVGRALRSIHGNELAARSLGVNITFYKVQVFVLSAAMASLAGSFHAHHERFVAPPSFGFHTSIVVVVMVVVGGMSNIWAAFLGAVFISFLEEELRTYQDWMLLIYGIILILVMMFVPEGIFVALGNLLRRVYRRAVPTGARKEIASGA